MKSQLKKTIEKAKSHIIVVEGKKDKKALQDLGFKNIFIIHETGKPLYWKIEKIAENCDKKDKICILTDFDKEGKKLYFLLKEKFQELGIKQDNSLRGALLKENISHIEGLSTYLKNHK